MDMERIVESGLHLNIEPKHGLLDEFDMDAYLRFDLSGIVVDYNCYMEEKFQNRLRFSFAHEVGHLVLHKGVYDELSISTPEEFKELILNESDKEYRACEWQANEFAGRLLVPGQRLELEINKVYKKIEAEGMLSYLQDDPDAVLSRVSPELKKPFGVSEDVIIRRAEREELWPPI